jgi:threonine synthase
VLAQVVYYFHAYYAAGQKPLAFSVPTGNFGDIFAGWLAAKMGLPITQLILATNENDILSVFFNTGRYARGDVKFTISPSMDIQVASNFERFLFYRLGENAEALRGAMESFAHSGAFHLDDGAPIDDLICAQAVGRAETLATITAVHEEEGYLLDPHTAVGVAAGRALRKGDEPLVCLATAHPSKFPEAVNGAVGASLATHPRVEGLAGLPKRSTPLPASEDAVKAFIEAHGRR